MLQTQVCQYAIEYPRRCNKDRIECFYCPMFKKYEEVIRYGQK